MSRLIDKFIKYMILALVSIFFLLIFSQTTTPLTSLISGDSAFFILVGQGMMNGMLPYRDFFDMKGPYLFEIQHLGQLLSYGRTGAFIMQCINLFLSLIIIDRIYHMNDQKKSWKKWLIYLCVFTFPCLAVASYTFENGNLTEEFSLPILLVALMMAMKYLQVLDIDSEREHSIWYGGYYGIAFGILLFIRITNAALLGAILFTITVDLLVRKKYKNLALNGVFFTIGCIIAISPACVYFEQHGLLKEMFFQVFSFGVKYSTEKSIVEKLSLLIRDYGNILITMLFPLIILIVFKVKNWKYWMLASLSYLLLVVAIVLGNVFRHYFTLTIPHLVLGFIFFIEQEGQFLTRTRNEKVVISIVIICLFAVMFRDVFANSKICMYRILAKNEPPVKVIEVKERIPEEDYESVFVYNMGSCSTWYMKAGIFPVYRYCDWHKRYIELNPKIGQELSEWIKAGNSKWIVVKADKILAPEIIADAILDNYSIYYQNDEYILYEFNESKIQ